MNKPTLWIMCGLSGSGKSTIAAQIANENPNTIIVSSDAIREELTGNYEAQEHNEEVFKIFHNRIRKNLENKKNVIADATNITMKSRRAIMVKVHGLNIRKVCVIIPKPFEKCKEDNLYREHPVPEYVLDKQVRRFQIPFEEEGFDKIQILSFDDEWNKFKFSNFEFLIQTYNFDQKNPHHTMTLDKHSLNVYKLFRDKRNPLSLFLLEYVDGYTMGAYLHDIGKLSTQSFDNEGIAHYFHHAEMGSYIILSQLKIPEPFSAYWNDDKLLDCCFLINYHMMPFNWTTDKAKRRWKERFGEYKYKILLDFNECDRAM